MDLKRFCAYAAYVLIAGAVVACKDDDEDTVSYEDLAGTLSFTVPEYVLPGQTLSLTPSGMSGNTVDIGYYWTVSPIYPDRDTTRALGDPDTVDGTYKLLVKDTLCTMSIICNAFATGYYTESATRSCTIVNPATTLTDTGIAEDTPSIVDARDNKTYHYTTVGGLDWFMENLSYGNAASFKECPAMDDIYGKYYTWNEAMTSCPPGWRLPDASDWHSLVTAAGYTGEQTSTYPGVAGALMVNARFNGDRMWEYFPKVKITNKTGFSALPTAYGTKGSSRNDWNGNLKYAVYWTSDSYDDVQGIYRLLYVESPDLMGGNGHKDSFLAAVRCVRNSE